MQEFLKYLMKKKNNIVYFLIFIQTITQMKMIKPEKNALFSPKWESLKLHHLPVGRFSQNEKINVLIKEKGKHSNYPRGG